MSAATGKRPGRPATGSVRVEFRASAPAAAFLASRRDRMPGEQAGSLDTQARTELELWQSVLAAELARIRLTLPQAAAIADVLGGPQMTAGISPGIGRVFAQCHEAFTLARSGPAGDYGSYGRKHGFNEDDLLRYLGSLGPAADHALADAFSRWWAEVQPRDGMQWRDIPPQEFPGVA